MDEILLITVIILIFGITFFLVAPKFRGVDAEVESHLGKARFSGQKDEPITSGKADLSNISGKNVEIGDVIGVAGDQRAIGEASLQNIQAQENIKIGKTIGTKNTKSS